MDSVYVTESYVIHFVDYIDRSHSTQYKVWSANVRVWLMLKLQCYTTTSFTELFSVYFKHY